MNKPLSVLSFIAKKLVWLDSQGPFVGEKLLTCFRSAVFLRGLCLFVIAFGITHFIFLQLAALTSYTTRVQSVDKEKGQYIEEYIGGNNGEVFKDISSLIKAPVSLIYFKTYVYNNWQFEKQTGETVNSLLNINIAGYYQHEIRFKETRQVVPTARGSEVLTFGLGSERLIVPEDKSLVLSSTTPPIEGSFYRIVIWPTGWSYFFTWLLVGLPLTHALFALANASGRFIVFGHPFVKKEGE